MRTGPLTIHSTPPITRAMDVFTRATDGTRQRCGRALAVLVTLVASAWLIATITAVSTAMAAATTNPRALTDAQLNAHVARLEAEATRVGELLLTTDSERDEIVQTRDAARGLLAGFLADSYRRNVSGGSTFRLLLGSASINEVADRVRVAQVISEHHTSIIRALDDAETRLAVSEVERAQLVVELSRAQRQLVTLTTEQGRRAAIRAEHARQRAVREQAAAARKERAARAAAPRGSSGAGVTAGAGAGVAVPAGTLVARGAGGTGGPVTAAFLDAYLASKGSPMTGQGAAFVASGQRWQVDPRLLVAIAGAESNFGAITCGPHNAWGWACPNDPAEFATWAMGIDTVTRGLRRYYLDEGRTSVSLIQQKYCPVGAANDPTGLNSHWTANVTKFLIELGGNPSMVGPGPSGGAMAPMLPGLKLARD